LATNVIGILGLTYKPNTDVVEESFGLLLAQETFLRQNLSSDCLRPVPVMPRVHSAIYKNIGMAIVGAGMPSRSRE